MMELVIIPAVLLLCAVLTCLVIAVVQSKHLFQCKHCGKTFFPKWTALFLTPHADNEYLLKCPSCNRKGCLALDESPSKLG